MKRLALVLFIAGALTASFSHGTAIAGEADILINKLVEKGILSRSEANQLLIDMQKESVRQKEMIKEVATEVAKEGGKGKTIDLPKWVNNTKFKGDIRLRYQGQERDNSGKPHRSRGRFRLRAGIESKLSDQWKAGFGIASGGDDPRSTNETMDDTFESPDLRIDYAFAQYKPFKSLSVMGGKFKNPVWNTKDLLWDGDIRPEGLAAQFKYKVLPDLELFVTPAFYILEEFSSNTGDPNMWLVQPGINWTFSDHVYLKLAGTVYGLDNVKGNDFTSGGAGGAGTNSQASDGTYLYDYDALAGDIEIGFTKIPGPIPFVALFGQYVRSGADDVQDMDGYDDNVGWLAGIKFGSKKVKGFGRWQFKYNYRELERDAWPDFFPDSDFYDGETNAKGHEAEFKFGLAKFATIGLDYYKTEPIRYDSPGDPKQEEDVLQVDLVLKW
ncbi:MAG: putative porin [Desulfatiglans sp.]|jgi:hypothetical protein|nr:putative porin [Desulfatiglans sp.]